MHQVSSGKRGRGSIVTFIDGQRVVLHHTHNVHLEPDWVIVGVRFDPTGEYAVVASLGVSEATITARAQQAVDLAGRAGNVDRVEELRARLHGYVVGFGSTYAEALADLVQWWSPDQRPAKVLDAQDPAGG